MERPGSTKLYANTELGWKHKAPSLQVSPTEAKPVLAADILFVYAILSAKHSLCLVQIKLFSDKMALIFGRINQIPIGSNQTQKKTISFELVKYSLCVFIE